MLWKQVMIDGSSCLLYGTIERREYNDITWIGNRWLNDGKRWGKRKMHFAFATHSQPSHVELQEWIFCPPNQKCCFLLCSWTKQKGSAQSIPAKHYNKHIPTAAVIHSSNVHNKPTQSNSKTRVVDTKKQTQKHNNHGKGSKNVHGRIPRSWSQCYCGCSSFWSSS